MTQLFGIPFATLANALLVITLIIVGPVALLACINFIFFKIGTRNIVRRRLQMVLIVFALMLSTTLLSGVLETGNVINATVQSVAVYNLGNVDETVEARRGGFFDDSVYQQVLNLQKQNADIAAVGAALVEGDLLLADATSRQVRSGVTGLGIVPGSEIGFGGMQREGGPETLRIGGLAPNAVYLNHTVAQLLNAHTGDTLYLYAKRWPGKRYELHVQDIVADGGLAAQKPYMLANVSTFRQIEKRQDDLTHLYIANRGGGGVQGVALSDSVSEAIEDVLPRNMRVVQVKEEGIQSAQKAEDLFTRVFMLFCLFALAIGLLLIFLIFVLLAAERRAEMGMARAIGVQRGQLVLMFLFEGAIYDLLASFVGLGFGVLLGALLVNFLGPLLQRFNFPLTLTFEPHSLIIAYCLGVIFTFCSVVISSWLVSRMTIVDALRNLPETQRARLTLGEMIRLLATLARRGGAALTRRSFQAARGIWLEKLPDLLVSIGRELIMLGIVPLLIGYWLLRAGLESTMIVPFSLGLSLLFIGGGLLLKALIEGLLRWLHIDGQRIVYRIFAGLVGLALVGYWALPFDVLAWLGLPRFQGGIEVFFVAGSMMILGAVWALMANAELFAVPLLSLWSRLPRTFLIAKIAVVYPLRQRFRAGMSVIMFSMVIFAMTVMTIITNAMQNNYADFNVQTGGYDIQAAAYFKAQPNLRAALASRGINPDDFSAIGMRTAAVAGVIQLDAANPVWKVYPAQVIEGSFLQGYGLQLVARARGFESDSAIWQALQEHPDYALIDNDALPYRPDYIPPVYDPTVPHPDEAGVPTVPPGLDSYYAFSMSGIYQGDKTFTPAPIWVTGVERAKAHKMTIIGVVNNSDAAHFGLYLNRAAYGNQEPQQPEAQTYYFKVAPGRDKHALALALGSAFLDNGLETTVLEDAVWQRRGPSIFISNVLLGMVGMVLLLGVAALAITGTRAVIERRQQIGMLRALGSGRRMIEGMFLCESLLVGCSGSLLGVVLGVVLARNIFAVDFFEQFNTGLAFIIPWDQLGVIVGIALLASLLAALLPAWQAGRVAPTEALRY